MHIAKEIKHSEIKVTREITGMDRKRRRNYDR
jgi:hypothetical protein